MANYNNPDPDCNRDSKSEIELLARTYAWIMELSMHPEVEASTSRKLRFAGVAACVGGELLQLVREEYSGQ